MDIQKTITESVVLITDDEAEAAAWCAEQGYTITTVEATTEDKVQVTAVRQSKPLDLSRPRLVRHNYAGSKWLKRQPIMVKGKRTELKVSSFGERVADLLGYVFEGLYHLDENKADDWNASNHIEFKLDRELSTYDDSRLTTLVLLAHHMAIRVVIQPLSHRSMKLIFHNRKRNGEWHNSHPSIAEAVALFEIRCGLDEAR